MTIFREKKEKSHPCEWVVDDSFYFELNSALKNRRPESLDLPDYTPAAVLLLLWSQNGRPHLLLTRRSDRVRHHKREISFPGGAVEPQDDGLCETALRETHEEVGVSPDTVCVLGRLDDVFSLTRFAITPFVGVCRNEPVFSINAEVKEPIVFSLGRLQNPDRMLVEHREHDGMTVPVYTYEVDGRVIWGATARILREFLHLVSPILKK